MSSERVTYGLMAELQFEVPEDRRHDIYDELEAVGLFINYEGTLIYHRNFDGESWEAGFITGLTEFGNFQDFISLCDKYGMVVKEETVDIYHCVWYDGADPPMNTIKLEEFRSR